MRSLIVEVGLKLSELALKVEDIPEEDLIEILATHRADEPFDERMDTGTWGTVLISSISRMRRFAFQRWKRKRGSLSAPR